MGTVGTLDGYATSPGRNGLHAIHHLLVRAGVCGVQGGGRDSGLGVDTSRTGVRIGGGVWGGRAGRGGPVSYLAKPPLPPPPSATASFPPPNCAPPPRPLPPIPLPLPPPPRLLYSAPSPPRPAYVYTDKHILHPIPEQAMPTHLLVGGIRNVYDWTLAMWQVGL